MLLIGFFALVLMLATPASAEPVSLSILGAISASLAASKVAVLITTAILTTMLSMALSYVASALLKPSGKSGGGAGMPDTSLNSKQSVRQPTAPLQIVYGKTKVGGVFADMWVSDATNQLLCGALIISGHEITGIDELWLGDENTILDSNGYITGGRYAGNGTFLQYFGTADQTACQMLIDNSNGRWTTNHRLRGLAYLAFQLYWDNTTGNGNPASGTFVVEHRGAKLWQGSLPNMTAVIRGRKIYDPRTGLTEYSNNSALVVADYLCDPVFGLGVDYATGIDETALIAAANACDEDVTLDAGGTEKRYTTDGFFKVDGSPDAILGRLLGAMHGQAIYDGERWVIKAGIWEEPDAVVLTDDDMRAASSLQTLTSTRDISNGVKGTYVGAETKWQPADFPSIKSATFTTDDGGVDKWRDIELPYSSTATRCQRLAKIDLLKQRYEIVETFKGKLSCWRYTAGQTVYRTSARYGWTNKAFMIGSVRVVPDQDAEGNPMVGVDLTLYETAASIYNWSTSEETPIRTPTKPNMGDVYNVLPPANYSANEEVYTTGDGLGVKSKIVLTWDASEDALVKLGGHYENQWRKVGDTEWLKLPNTTDTLQEILDVKPASYQFRIRAVNYAGNPSSYVTDSLTVTGDGTPPEDVVGFTASSGISGYTTFTWTAPVYERARAGTAELRWASGTSGVVWSGATPVAIQSAYNTQAILQTKVGTYLIKYKSQNGVYSTNAASAVITTTAQPIVGIEIVNSLPTTDLYEGRVVYLTTDNKLYRYDGTQWTTAVPALDISGTLADAQIASLAASKITGQLSDSQLAALSAAKLTGQITSTQISDSSISTPKLAAGSVSTAKIAAGAVTANEIAAAAITATKIQAGAVETAAIAAGAIQAGNIAAGAVVAGKIAANAITSTELASNAVTADKITAGAVTAAKISVNQLSAMSADLGSVTAGTITGLTHQTASAGAVRAVFDTRIMFRCEDPNYATRTYYRSVGWSEPNITSHIGAEGGYSYSRLLNYGGTTALDVQSFGNNGSPASTPSSTGVYSRGEYKGVLGSGNYIGVEGYGTTYDFMASGPGSNYGPFTGTHDALILKTDAADVGDIVVDVEIVAQKSISNAITRVEKSSAAEQRGALGVVSSRAELHPNAPPPALAGPRSELQSYDVLADEHTTLTTTHDRLTVNAVGEGLINVCCQGGDIAIGDLIVTSDTPGKGMRQSDDIIRGYTVAKAREAATFATAGEVKTIACIYVSG